MITLWRIKGQRIFTSLICLVIAILILFWVFRADQGKTFPLLSWVRRYSLPDLGLGLVSTLLASIAWLFILLGFVKEVGVLGQKVDLSPTTPKLRTSIFGLPPLFLVVVAGISALGLMVLPPSCEVPSVVFAVRAGSGEAREYTPESEAEIARTGSAIIYLKGYPSLIEASAPQDDLICTFEASGSVIERLGVPNHQSCVTTVYLKKDLPGNMVIKADVKGKYCSLSSSYNLSLLIK